MNNIIRAERATVKFCEGVEVDGYLLPDGEFRVGKVGAAIAVGYGKDWVGQLKGKPLKALQDKGQNDCFFDIIYIESIFYSIAMSRSNIVHNQLIKRGNNGTCTINDGATIQTRNNQAKC